MVFSGIIDNYFFASSTKVSSWCTVIKQYWTINNIVVVCSAFASVVDLWPKLYLHASKQYLKLLTYLPTYLKLKIRLKNRFYRWLKLTKNEPTVFLLVSILNILKITFWKKPFNYSLTYEIRIASVIKFNNSLNF